MKKISELKDFGYTNILGTFLISFFFYLLHYYAKKNEFGFLGLHIYICFVANGYFIIHHIKGGWKTDKSIFDSFILIPTIGAIAFAFWFIFFVVLDNFTEFSFYFMYLLPVELL